MSLVRCISSAETEPVLSFLSAGFIRIDPFIPKWTLKRREKKKKKKKNEGNTSGFIQELTARGQEACTVQRRRRRIVFAFQQLHELHEGLLTLNEQFKPAISLQFMRFYQYPASFYSEEKLQGSYKSASIMHLVMIGFFKDAVIQKLICHIFSSHYVFN